MLSPDLTRLAQICASGGDQTNRVLGGCASGAGRIPFGWKTWERGRSAATAPQMSGRVHTL